MRDLLESTHRELKDEFYLTVFCVFVFGECLRKKFGLLPQRASLKLGRNGLCSSERLRVYPLELTVPSL